MIGDMLTQFHNATEGVNGDEHNYKEWAALRIRLLREELAEVEDAITRGIYPEIARELADLVYVAFGTAVRLEIDLDIAVTEVHRANMSKMGPDGKPLIREDGKILKGPYFTTPNMTAALPQWMQETLS